jgi:hypothetical protein
VICVFYTFDIRLTPFIILFGLDEPIFAVKLLSACLIFLINEDLGWDDVE